MGRGGMSFDVDAADYFSRVAGVGGDFASSLYTATTTQNAINEWFVASRDFGFYSKIAEAYLFVGPTFPGLFAKLKHAGVNSLTNVNFVSGDLVQSGPGAGLKGDANNKRLETAWFPNSVMTAGSGSLGIYAEDLNTTVNTGFIMVADLNAAAAPHCSVLQNNTVRTGNLSEAFSSPDFRSRSSVALVASFDVVSRDATNAQRYFVNGVQSGFVQDKTNTGVAAGSLGLFSFRYGQGTGSYSHSAFSSMRAKFAFAGTGLDNTEVANLSATTNALMTRLGANVYGPVAPPAASVRRKHAAAHFFTSRF